MDDGIGVSALSTERAQQGPTSWTHAQEWVEAPDLPGGPAFDLYQGKDLSSDFKAVPKCPCTGRSGGLTGVNRGRSRVFALTSFTIRSLPGGRRLIPARGTRARPVGAGTGPYLHRVQLLSTPGGQTGKTASQHSP